MALTGNECVSSTEHVVNWPRVEGTGFVPRALGATWLL